MSRLVADRVVRGAAAVDLDETLGALTDLVVCAKCREPSRYAYGNMDTPRRHWY